MQKLRLEIYADLNRLLLAYRERSTLHRQLGTAFKQILMTTSSPSRIWTGNWSTQQIEDLENMINPELIQSLQPSALSTIPLPLEKIIAEGALNLWQCKVVQERVLSQRATLTSSPSVYQEPNKFPKRVKKKGTKINLSKLMSFEVR